MPYALSLQAYCLPEFEARAPDSWERRLREISPILPNTAHLGFRKFDPRPDWQESLFNTQPDRPLWAIYKRTPKHLVDPMMAAQLAKHWSEYPLHPEKQFPECEQMAQKALVSDYQHFIWHTQGVWATPFWLLQGEWGGTPMKFTKREKRYLDGAGQSSIPAPPGAFTPCVFDERAVKQILERDRLIQAGNRFDALEAMDSTSAKRAEDDAAELVYREQVLASLSAMAQPAVEYMKSQRGKREIEGAVVSGFLKPAPTDLPDTLATWKDHFRQTGVLPHVTAPSQRKPVFAH